MNMINFLVAAYKSVWPPTEPQNNRNPEYNLDSTTQAVANVGHHALSVISRNTDQRINVQKFAVTEMKEMAKFALEMCDRAISGAKVLGGIAISSLSAYGLAHIPHDQSETNPSWNLAAKTILCMAAIGGLTYSAVNAMPNKRRKDAIPISANNSISMHPTLSTDSLPGEGIIHENALLKAAFEGETGEIVKWQKDGKSLATIDGEGRTAMHWAAIGGKIAAIECLWYFGCEINSQDNYHYAPVHYAKEENVKAIFTKLKKMRNRFTLPYPNYIWYPPVNLVFQGGGPKGIAFVGAIEFLETHELLRHLRRVAGTSAGAITAMLVALGYTASELYGILSKTNLTSFLSNANPALINPDLPTVMNLLMKPLLQGTDVSLIDAWRALCTAYQQRRQISWQEIAGILTRIHGDAGFCNGQNFFDWIDGLIFDKTKIKSCTFGEYKEILNNNGHQFKHIYFYAISLKKENLECFNSEDDKWNEIVIADAIRASMSIPGVFTPHIVRKKEKALELQGPLLASGPRLVNTEYGPYIDGGLINNLPIDTFDKGKFLSTNPDAESGLHPANPGTLAFALHDPVVAPIGPDNNNPSLFQVLRQALGFAGSATDVLINSNENHTNRMVKINNQGIGLITGFFSTPEDMELLVQSGRHATRTFINGSKSNDVKWDPRELLSWLKDPKKSDQPQANNNSSSQKPPDPIPPENQGKEKPKDEKPSEDKPSIDAISQLIEMEKKLN